MEFAELQRPSLLKKVLDGLLRLLGLLSLITVAVVVAAALFASKWLVVNQPPVAADGIVVLIGSYASPLYAAELYQQGYAKRVFVSRPIRSAISQRLRPLDIRLPAQEEVCRKILMRKGVRAADIVLYGEHVLSTMEEAESLRRSMPDPPHRLLIVTSPIHTRRAKAIFSRLFPHTEIVMLATPYEPFPEKWWRDRQTAIHLTLELSKTVFYYLGGVFRSTDKG